MGKKKKLRTGALVLCAQRPPSCPVAPVLFFAKGVVMTNGLFWLLITIVAIAGALAGIVLDTPKTQFGCLCLGAFALIMALRVNSREAANDFTP